MQFSARAAFAALCGLMLAACVDSGEPILTDSQQSFGPTLRLQLYTLRDGAARDPEQARFAWNGKEYVRKRGLRDVASFSVHPFEAGNFILQETPTKRPHIREYALLHPVADGVYLVRVIDEEDTDADTRKAHCGKGDAKDPSPCRITNREQLLAFARATAASKKKTGVLAIQLEDRRRPTPRQP
jgi:hypothetical protein